VAILSKVIYDLFFCEFFLEKKSSLTKYILYFKFKKNVTFGKFLTPKKETSTQHNWQAIF